MIIVNCKRYSFKIEYTDCVVIIYIFFIQKLEEMQKTCLKLSDDGSNISEKNKSLELEMLCMAKDHSENLEKLKDSFKDKEDRLVELKESHKLLVQVNKQLSDNINIVQENLDKVWMNNFFKENLYTILIIYFRRIKVNRNLKMN